MAVQDRGEDSAWSPPERRFLLGLYTKAGDTSEQALRTTAESTDCYTYIYIL